MSDTALADALDAIAGDPELLDAFRAGWHDADDHDDYGNRVPSGLRAIAQVVRDRDA